MARISLVFSRVLVNFTGFLEIRWRYMNSKLHTAHTHTEIALSSDIYMGLSIFFYQTTTPKLQVNEVKYYLQTKQQ